MLDLALISPPLTSEPPSISSVLAPRNTTTILARSRRPAILPYQSPITSMTNTFISLPLHALSLRDIDATMLSIPMFERVTFARGGRNLPASARLEIQTQAHTQAALLGQAVDVEQHVPLQVYCAGIEFHARFRGLRWLMYNWRILSFLAFTSAFYCVALISTGLVWGIITLGSPSLLLGKKEDEERTKIKKEAEGDREEKTSNGPATRPVKKEPADEEGGESGEESALSLSNLSDNATTFPTLGRQMPIRYPLAIPYGSGSASGSASGSGRIKKEDPRGDDAPKVEATIVMESPAPTTAGEFAEDEEEELDRGRDRDRDSGIGTSMEESAREAGGLQRRKGGRGGSSGSGSKR